MRKSLILSLAIFGCVVLYTSCDKEKDPAFAGKWEYIDVEDETKITLDLSKSGMVFSLYFMQANAWTLGAFFEGNISYTETTISVTPYRVTGYYLGQELIFEPGDAEFESFLNEMGFENNVMTIGYTVNGNQLIVEFDGETETFTKV